MTQSSMMYSSPGPKPRAESRQNTGDYHNILEQLVENPWPFQIHQRTSGSQLSFKLKELRYLEGDKIFQSL